MTVKSNEPVLLVRLDGPEVHTGRVPLNDLVHLGRHFQLAVERVGRVLAKGGQVSIDGSSPRSSKTLKEIRAACVLEVVAFHPGSFQMALDLSAERSQVSDSDFGLQALEHLITGLEGLVRDRASLPTGYDDKVLQSWAATAEIFDHGVNQVEFTLRTDGASRFARYTPQVQQHVAEWLSKMSSDVPIDRRAEPDVVFAQPELIKEVPRYRLPATAPSPAVFWSGQSIEALAEVQGVRPVVRLEQLYGDFWPEDQDVDEVLNHIYAKRHLDRGH